jgi:hypothetical protein
MRCEKSVRDAPETGPPIRPADWGALSNGRLLLALHPPSQSVSTFINVRHRKLLTLEEIIFQIKYFRTAVPLSAFQPVKYSRHALYARGAVSLHNNPFGANEDESGSARSVQGHKKGRTPLRLNLEDSFF